MIDQETVTSVAAGLGMGGTLLATWLAVRASKARDAAVDTALGYQQVLERFTDRYNDAVTEVVDLGLARPLDTAPRYAVPSAEDFRQWNAAAAHGRVQS